MYAPPNPLRGLPQDPASLHQFLTQNAALQGRPVVLVGHSYGGAVITNAAVGDPYPGAPAGDADLYIKPALIAGCFATCLPANQAAVIAATQRPLTASASTEASGTPAWKTIPSWTVIGTADRVIPPAEQMFMAQRAGAHVSDVNTGHLSLISAPSLVTRVILEAVQATR